MTAILLTPKRALSLVLLLCLSIIFVPDLSAQVQNRSGQDSTIFVSHTVFVPRDIYPAGDEGWGVDIGDMNGDGWVDIVSISKDGKVHIHYNDQQGKFRQKKSFSGGTQLRDVVVLDHNRDGKLDVATVSLHGKVVWLTGDGQGNLGSPRSLTTGPFPHDIIAADMNQDGIDDLVIAINSGNKINFHYGDGAGNFAGAVSIPSSPKPRSVWVDDLDKDGIPDMIVGSDGRCVNVHWGLGGGKYSPGQCELAGQSIWGLGVGDFDKDGIQDFVSCSYSDNRFCFHKGLGNRKFERGDCYDAGDKNFGLVVDDFDMDGDLDVVVASTRDEVINVFLGDGAGKFSKKNKITSGNWNSAIRAVDVDNDKDPDVITSSIKDGKMNVHRNKSIGDEEEVTSTCVYGVIRDKDSNAPLQSIVAIVGDDGYSIASVKTGKDGAYKLCDINFGTYVIKAKARGYPKYEETLEVPESAGKDGVEKDIYLEKIKETYVYGRVTDIETKQALAGATVSIKNKNGEPVTTLTCDAQGNYKTLLPFDDNYELTASFEKYNEKIAIVSVYPNNYPDGVQRNFELLKIKPKTTACIKGYVMEQNTKEKLADATVTVQDKDGNIIKQVKSDETGYYEACKVPFGTYDITGNKKGYMFKLYKDITVAPEHVETGVTQDVELLKFEIGMKIVLENIYYDVAKATLRDESIAELDRLIKIMNENPTLVVEIGGHTDSDGSDSYNQRLSQARSQSVVDYLTDAGIPTERMVAKGYGEKEPIVPNDSKENKQLNRRTEFKVLDF